MSTNDDAHVREPWLLAEDCDSSLRRARRRRSIAARLRARTRRRRSARSSLLTFTALLAVVAPLSLAAGGGGTLLRRGSSGTNVSAVQRALGVSPTGTFGPVTTRAVRAFQSRHGLTPDGIVGPLTRAALGLGGQAPTTSAPAAPRSGAASTTLARIAACESGGNPTAISRSGLYRGKYQFSRATWRAMGGTGDPAKAPEAEQDRLAAALLAKSGTAPWPVCG
jgi:peptidoglycan hydrolase-like protein with peptidoglycan-binding domain